MGKNMDAYGVPHRRSHHGQWSGARQNGLKPAGSSGGKTSMVVAQPAIGVGMMLAVALLIGRHFGWTPSPVAFVIAASVVCAVGLVTVFVIAKRTPIL